jgi:outer membrane protein OmpA-like peptidoglycan-associated protein
VKTFAAASTLSVALLAVGCSSSNPAEPEPSAEAAKPEPSAEVAEPGDPPTDSDSPSELMPVIEQPLGTLEQTNAANEAACVPSEDQTVEMLDPLVIAEVRVEPVTFEAVESDGARVEETTVPGFVIPEQTVNVGCIIHEKAPAGCLGGVRITGFEIPGVRLPAVTIPERVLPDGTVQPAETVPAQEVEPVKVDGASVDSVCQVVKDGVRPSVLRPSVLRPSALRPSALRPSLLQPSQSVEFETEDGETVLFSAPIRTIGLTAVSLQSVGPASAPVMSLPYEQLEAEPEVDVAEGDVTTAYVAPSSVLFDEDKAVLKTTAREALRAIVADLNKKSPKGQITIDGYTDNQGSKASGLSLSKARAEAVARFLTTTGGVARSRIAELNGYGEANPAFPNDTEANMAKNRRVVISVEN